MNRTKILKDLIASGHILIAPGCYDCVTALVAQTVGFNIVYLSGYGSSASLLGLPDLGLMTLPEIVTHARNVVNCLNIPVICDADNGYGNHLNVIRTVREFEGAGVSAIHLEDQVLPKKCGHMEGKRVISVEEHVQKIRAAIDTRREMLIIARTDAGGPLGFDEAIRRCNMYLEAGADLVFIDALESKEEIKDATRLVKGPLVINITEGGKTPIVSAPELEEIGYKILIHADSALYTTVKSVSATFKELLTQQTTKNILPNMIDFREFNKFIKTHEFEKFDKRYRLD
jgi:2-methylisocitrate lyase-like PEP mutase family enzyme